MDRREFLIGAAALAGATCVTSAAAARSAQTVVAARRFPYALTQGAPASELWAFETPEGPSLLGAPLRFELGDRLDVRLSNELDAGVSIHWHGMRVPNAMDGTMMAQAPVMSGELFDYSFPVLDPGTFWFHSHHRSWEQVARGLYGVLVVPDPNDPPMYDLPIILDDWRVDEEGRQDLASLGSGRDWSHAGRIGNLVTINGAFEPAIDVPKTGWIRLRLLNAGTAGFFIPELLGAPAHIIAFDGYAVTARPVDSQNMVMGPGQRVDVALRAEDIPPQGLELRSNGELRGRLTPSEQVAPGDAHGDVLGAFRSYAPEELQPTAAADQKTTLTISGGAMGRMVEPTLKGRPAAREELVAAQKYWAFNGVADGMGGGWEEPFFECRVGETVEITLANQSRWPHAIHVHGQHFSVLENPTLPHEVGLFRDSVNVAQGDTVKIALKSWAVGRWPIHCHMLGHQASGMGTWFNVV